MSFTHITSTEWAYAAGILDGEGSMRLRDYKRSRSGTEITVGNTDQPLITWLYQKFGGKTTIRESKTLPNAKPWYVWYLPAKCHTEFLTGVLPYLVIKSRIAQLMLELRQDPSFGNRHRQVTGEVAAKRDAYWEEHKSLSKLGR